MTDIESVVQDETPKPKRLQRPRPVPRHPSGDVDRLAVLEAEIAELRQQQAGYVPAQSERKPEATPAAPETLTDFQRELAAKARPTPKNYVRDDPGYNYPLAWFARPDGDIVQLQGDPQNRALYTDLGFHLLDPDEVERWEKVERAKVVTLQRQVAHRINSIRRLIALNPTLQAGLGSEYELDLQKMTVAELDEQWAALTRQSGQPNMVLPRLPRLVEREDREAQATLRGVDTAASMTKEQFESKISRGNGRTQEVLPGRPRNFV